MKFRTKLFSIILIAILVPSATTATLIYVQAEQSLAEQAKRGVAATMEQSLETLDSNLNTLGAISGRISREKKLVDLIQSLSSTPQREHSAIYAAVYSELQDYLSMLKAPNILGNIQSLYLYLPDQDVVVTTDTTYYENAGGYGISFIEKDADYKDKWFSAKPITFDTLHKADNTETLISCNNAILDNQGRRIGICAVNIHKSAFYDMYGDFLLSMPGGVLVAEETGARIDAWGLGPLSAADLSKALSVPLYTPSQSAPKLRLSSGGYYVVSRISKETGWRYCTVIRDTGVLNKLYSTRQFLTATIGLTALCVLIISGLIVRSFYKPLNSLVDAMQEIEDRNLDVRIQDDRKDEYRKVFDGFNNMVQELGQLIDNLETEKTLNKEAQIKLLQEQINPHFLYNTLDSIYSIAKIHDEPEISRMVHALSQFFRVSLSGGKDIVTLREAVQIAQSYITVQDIRFKGKFDIALDIPEALMDCKTFKLVLQPFVENAIYHGLERKGCGQLRISARRDKEALLLCVEDDGKGIPPQRLREIQDTLRGGPVQEGKNFAIRNLNTQIKLRYGEGYGISLWSAEDVGTKVTIVLPYEQI